MTTDKERNDFTPSPDSGETAAPKIEEDNTPAEPYSIYSRREKWFIVALIGLGGLFRLDFPLSCGIHRFNLSMLAH